MKKLLPIILVAVVLFASWAGAQQYDLREYPSAGRGTVIMGADLPPSWCLDVWINPVLVGGQPQGDPTYALIPHPTGQPRSQECDIRSGVGAVTALAIAWEWQMDRAGRQIRVIQYIKYPIVRYIGQIPDNNGYYWSMYIGLAELGVRGFGTFY
jgi:hypothetical protein